MSEWLVFWHAAGVTLHIAMLATDGCWVAATRETARDLGYGVVFGHVILLLGIATLWPVILYAMFKLWADTEE